MVFIIYQRLLPSVYLLNIGQSKFQLRILFFSTSSISGLKSILASYLGFTEKKLIWRFIVIKIQSLQHRHYLL